MLVLVILSILGQTTDYPVEMIAMEQSRVRLITGRVEWSRKVLPRPGVPNDAVGEMFYVSRVAGDSYTLLCRGDKDGVLYRDRDGKPVDRYTFIGRPEHFLVDGEGIWRQFEHGTLAELYHEKTPYLIGWDIRALGMTIGLPDNAARLEEVLVTRKPSAGPPSRFSVQRKDDGLVEIRASSADGERTCWLVDPRKDWSPIRIWRPARAADEPSLQEARIRLKKWQDVWFPEKVTYYVGRNIPGSVIKVQAAEFNQPNQPSRLVPRDIGIVRGTNVYEFLPSSTPGGYPKVQQMAYDGDDVVPFLELNRRMKGGQFKIDPEYVANREFTRQRQSELDRRFKAGDPKMVGDSPDLWDRWLDHLAAVVSFNEGQKIAAEALLREYRRRGEREKLPNRSLLFDAMRQRIVALLNSAQLAKWEREEFQNQSSGHEAERSTGRS